MNAKKLKVLSKGVPMGLNVNAREVIAARRDALAGPSMRSLAPEDFAQVEQKYAAIVPRAQDLIRLQQSVDQMQNTAAMIGRATPNITSWPDTRTNAGVTGQRRARQPAVAPNNQQEKDGQVLEEILSTDSKIEEQPENKIEEKQLDEESKGMLLMVVLGAALATVLVAFS